MADAFTGIDPDDTLTVNYHGAEITVGVIPQGVWERLKAELAVSHRDAKRRAIFQLHATGKDPAEVLTFAGRDVQLADVAAMRDPSHLENLFRISLEAAGWAVRGHKNWVRRNGEPVPFETITRVYEGMEFKLLAPATLRFYAANPGLVDDIYSVIRKLHDLEDAAKKASPPQP